MRISNLFTTMMWMLSSAGWAAAQPAPAGPAPGAAASTPPAAGAETSSAAAAGSGSGATDAALPVKDAEGGSQGAAVGSQSAAMQGPSTKQLSEQIVTQQAGLKEHSARLVDLQKQIATLEKELSEQREAEAQRERAASAGPTLPEWLEKLRDINLTGYIQGQYENHQESEDQLRPGGATMNQNRFLVRRARVHLWREWQFASFYLELDGNTVRGPSFGLQRAEASVMYRADSGAAPLVKLTAGQFLVPFGYELVESPRKRLFMERSQASRAFYPSEPDLGAKLSGEIRWLRYDLAILNGEPAGQQSGFALQDPNGSKDLLLHVGALAHPADTVELSGGISVMNGTGFVKGSDASKGGLTWLDKNQNQVVDPYEIQPIPASAASPSYNFKRWMAGADLQIGLKLLPVGTTKLLGEVLIASNMDRALYVANPVQGGTDSRELGYYLAVTQEITPYASVGFRYDYYDPNADYLGYKSGKLVPDPQTIHTFSPAVALMIPNRARLVFQYDVIRDHLGRTQAGLPTDLANDTWTLRLQGEL